MRMKFELRSTLKVHFEEIKRIRSRASTSSPNEERYTRESRVYDRVIFLPSSKHHVDVSLDHR
jgi:hypothetical protein